MTELKGIAGLTTTLALLGSANAYEAFNGPTEVIHHVPEKTAPGYLMFSPSPKLDDHEYTYLVDTEGNVVH